MADTYVKALTTLNDPRVFVTCEPAWAYVAADPNPCKYNYFVGASTGLPLAIHVSAAVRFLTPLSTEKGTIPILRANLTC